MSKLKSVFDTVFGILTVIFIIAFNLIIGGASIVLSIWAFMWFINLFT